MSDAPISPGRPERFLECPECGERFAPRGFAAHRRMRHGITPDAAVELAGTLSRIAAVLERLDERLAAEEKAGEPKASTGGPEDGVARGTDPEAIRAALPSRSARTTAGKLLEQGLRDVMDEIARVKRETDTQISRHGQPMTEEQKVLERTAFQVLGTLRRRQAELIYRMQTETGANGNGIDALASI
jgi:hypothetical protein